MFKREYDAIFKLWYRATVYFSLNKQMQRIIFIKLLWSLTTFLLNGKFWINEVYITLPLIL